MTSYKKFTKNFLSKERTFTKKEYNSFGKAFLPKKRFVLKEKLRKCSSIKGLILLPILTKTLGAEFYGIWAQMLVTVSLLMPLALLQLGYAMMGFLAAEKDKEKISKGFSSIFVAVSATALFYP